MAFTLRIPSPEDRDLFYSGNDRESSCIGHLRGYFDCDTLVTGWFQHQNSSADTPAFREELNNLLSVLGRSLLHDQAAMRRFLRVHPTSELEQGRYGYCTYTIQRDYYIRVSPAAGDYCVYIYAYTR